MKLQQSVLVTKEDVLKIVTRVVESKTKKKVIKVTESGDDYVASLEDSAIEDAAATPAKQ